MVARGLQVSVCAKLGGCWSNMYSYNNVHRLHCVLLTDLLLLWVEGILLGKVWWSRVNFICLWDPIWHWLTLVRLDGSLSWSIKLIRFNWRKSPHSWSNYLRTEVWACLVWAYLVPLPRHLSWPGQYLIPFTFDVLHSVGYPTIPKDAGCHITFMLILLLSVHFKYVLDTDYEQRGFFSWTTMFFVLPVVESLVNSTLWADLALLIIDC